MARTCDDCKKRAACTKICAEVEAQLPGIDAGRGIGVVDERKYALAGMLSDLRGKAPWRAAAMCALYYRCGWTQAEISGAMECSRLNVTRQLQAAARRYARNGYISGNV